MTVEDTAPAIAPDVITVRNPASGLVVGTVPDQSAGEVAAKVSALRRAQRDWEALGPEGRKPWLLAFQDWVVDNARHIADVVQSETGKSRQDAEFEAPAVADIFGYYTRRAAAFLADEHPRPHSPLSRVKRLTTVYRPYPVVGVITPWNFPFAIPGLDVAGALAAGAAVLLKPSEVTPLSGVLFVEGWRAIGAPPVLDLATGAGATGAAVADAVDFVQFTGSTRTGKAVGRRAVERLIPYSLELGGKDPAIVLADADLERAVNGIVWGGLFNSGQGCICVERVYVEAPVYDEFLDRLTSAVTEVRQGRDGGARDGYRYDIGAMATPAQVEIVRRHVDEAVAAGARVLTGGAAQGGFFEPTVLVDVDHSMSCIREETFGPTLPVIKVADEAEAVRLANDSDYGLSATVWTGDVARGERLARQLEVGAVNVNDALSNMFSYALPMGGWKQSGVGARLGGAHGIRKYCRQQAITAPRIPTQPRELHWYPVSKRRARFALAVLRAAGARGRRRFGIRGRG